MEETRPPVRLPETLDARLRDFDVADYLQCVCSVTNQVPQARLEVGGVPHRLWGLLKQLVLHSASARTVSRRVVLSFVAILSQSRCARYCFHKHRKRFAQ